MCVVGLINWAAWSRVCGNLHLDICSDGGTHREPEVQWGGDSDRECGMRRACGDDSDSFHRPYLRSSPQPLPHDCLRRASSLPVGASSGLYRSTSFSIHLRFLRSQGCFPPIHVWWCHRPFGQHWAGLRP